MTIATNPSQQKLLDDCNDIFKTSTSDVDAMIQMSAKIQSVTNKPVELCDKLAQKLWNEFYGN